MQNQLKSPPKTWVIITIVIGGVAIFYKKRIFSVSEVKYEKVYPTIDGVDIQNSTEFFFVIPPSLDYFTR